MEVATSGETCKNCAECCKHYAFIELSQTEIEALEKFTGLSLDVFTNAKGKAVEEYFLKFKENGDCYFLNTNNGSYSCDAYEARSAICRNYPSNPSQNKACEANMKLCLGNNS
jgi:Fe-S-cluster containining protein